MPQSSLQVTGDRHRGAGMKILPGKASSAHTDTLGAHRDLSAQGAECKPCQSSDWEGALGPCSSPLPQTHCSLCLWVLLVAGTETGPHKRALNTPSPTLTLTCISLHINTAEPKRCWGCTAKSPSKHVDESSASPAGKAGKALSLPFFPACSRTHCWTARGSTPGAPLFHRIPGASCTHLSMSPPPVQGAPVLQPPRWHETSAGASPPWPPCRENHSKDPPKLGWNPCTDTPAEPRDNILVIQRNFFIMGQDFPRDLMEHHVHNVKGGIVQLLIQKEPSTSDQLRK